uniref:Uncharacterized protein n=1 Tax=Timema bartmani TaxID=61472 RepID=A0A7R9ELL2_9NEOP|nr:unnamed protein product [Timema bartmani]
MHQVGTEPRPPKTESGIVSLEALKPPSGRNANQTTPGVNRQLCLNVTSLSAGIILFLKMTTSMLLYTLKRILTFDAAFITISESNVPPREYTGIIVVEHIVVPELGQTTVVSSPAMVYTDNSRAAGNKKSITTTKSQLQERLDGKLDTRLSSNQKTKIIVRGNVPTFASKESGKLFCKTTQSSPYWDSNLNLPFIGILVYHESSALDLNSPKQKIYTPTFMFFQPPFPHIDLFFNPSWSLYTSKEDISRHAALIEGLLSVFQRGRKNFYVIIFVVVLFIVFSQMDPNAHAHTYSAVIGSLCKLVLRKLKLINFYGVRNYG